MPAFYKSQINEFVLADLGKLKSQLVGGTAGRGFDLKADQHASWGRQLEILRSSLVSIVESAPGAKQWGLLLEYEIPGRPRRLDAVILDGFGIIAIEFKIGSTEFRSGDRWQLREYCWDLRDFHKESEAVPIAPILVASDAIAAPLKTPAGFEDKRKTVVPMLCANEKTLSEALLLAHKSLRELGPHPLDLAQWDQSQTHLISSLVVEAQRLFAAHDVREVHHSHADNTGEALDELVRIVRESKVRKLRSMCFVTGVPGAGKTLVGLHAAYSPEMSKAAGTAICFASGNQPLLDVLHAALTENRAKDKKKRREVSQELSTPVNVHRFALENLLDPQERPPLQQVVIFDEAQRVWTDVKVKKGLATRVNREHLEEEDAARVLSGRHSEPDILLRVMERCLDWCVVVALVGGGQEIHDGEAGLAAWGTALAGTEKHWTIWASTQAIHGDASTAHQALFPSAQPPNVEAKPTPSLHLTVSKRSVRAEKYAEWVNHVVSGRPDLAAEIHESLSEFPIHLRRTLRGAKEAILEYAGRSRVGLLASSGAVRLRADGVEVQRQFREALEFPHWFLRPHGDIRSSNQLEVAATEFECQGLELDWTLVCWGGDFVWDVGSRKWIFRQLRNRAKGGQVWGPAATKKKKMTKVDEEKGRAKEEFIRNKYRVLLTRARSGTIIYVPSGDHSDRTRDPSDFDAVADYLRACGLT